MIIKDRIKELRRVKASELLANPKNWRTHPTHQQEAVQEALGKIGIADAVIARELSDGTLELLDGHLRQDIVDNDQELPVLVVDLDDHEADILLATLDPLAAMAQPDNDALSVLLKSIDEESPALNKMFSALTDGRYSALSPFPFEHKDASNFEFWHAPNQDAVTGEHAFDYVGYDLGSVWTKDSPETMPKEILLPLPPNPAGSNTNANYSRSPIREMEAIVRTYMRPEDKFLEVCAGWFTYSATAAYFGHSGDAIDSWDKSIAFGREQVKMLPPDRGTFNIHQGDALALPFEDNSYDIVYCNPPFYSIEHYSDLDIDLANSPTEEIWLERCGIMMKEMSRVVKPTGLIITVMADGRVDGDLVPLASKWIIQGEKSGLILHDIAIQHLLTQQVRWWRKSYKARRTAKAHEYICVFRKGE